MATGYCKVFIFLLLSLPFSKYIIEVMKSGRRSSFDILARRDDGSFPENCVRDTPIEFVIFFTASYSCDFFFH